LRRPSNVINLWRNNNSGAKKPKPKVSRRFSFTSKTDSNSKTNVIKRTKVLSNNGADLYRAGGGERLILKQICDVVRAKKTTQDKTKVGHKWSI
jgi:hypothetical protein